MTEFLLICYFSTGRKRIFYFMPFLNLQALVLLGYNKGIFYIVGKFWSLDFLFLVITIGISGSNQFKLSINLGTMVFLFCCLAEVEQQHKWFWFSRYVSKILQQLITFQEGTKVNFQTFSTIPWMVFLDNGNIWLLTSGEATAWLLQKSLQSHSKLIY
jgi:hypothetical protein